MHVTIIIPTFNKAKFLVRLLQNLQEQDYPAENFEVIVVDDGSTDDTELLCGKAATNFKHFTYLKQANTGPSAARNAGIKRAKGEYVAFIDDDNSLPVSYLSRMMASFKESDAQVLKPLTVPANESYIQRVSTFQYNYNLLRNFSFGGQLPLRLWVAALPFENETVRLQSPTDVSGAVMIRRRVLLDVGLFREDLRIGEDSELGKRLAAKGITFFVDAKNSVSIYYRERLSDSFYRAYEYGSAMSLNIVSASEVKYLSWLVWLKFPLLLIYLLYYTFRTCMYAGSWRNFFSYFPFLYVRTASYGLGAFHSQFSFLKNPRKPSA